MFNSFLSWTDLNRGCVFRFVNGAVTEERGLAVSTLKIKQPPHLPGGEAVFVDISGKRVSNLSSAKCFRDFSLSWKELGDDVDDFIYIVARCFETQLAGGSILFSPTTPYNEIRATEVLFSVTDEVMGLVYDDQAKMMPAAMELKSVNSFDFVSGLPNSDGPGPAQPTYTPVGIKGISAP